MSSHLITGHNVIPPNLGARSVNDPFPVVSDQRQLARSVSSQGSLSWSRCAGQIILNSATKYSSIGDAVKAT